MRWPWVSRRAFEIASAEWATRAIVAEARAAKFETLYGDLVKELLAMKRENFVTPEKRPTIAPTMPSASDEAIRARAGSNGALRAHLTRWRDQERAAGMTDEELALRIKDWRTASDDE